MGGTARITPTIAKTTPRSSIMASLGRRKWQAWAEGNGKICGTVLEIRAGGDLRCWEALTGMGKVRTARVSVSMEMQVTEML